jgi:hypothetical protein
MCKKFQQVAGAKRHIKLPFCISAAPVVALFCCLFYAK